MNRTDLIRRVNDLPKRIKFEKRGTSFMLRAWIPYNNDLIDENESKNKIAVYSRTKMYFKINAMQFTIKFQMVHFAWLPT